jgi:hypothetical protein
MAGLLGDMVKLDGNVEISGSIAYVSQQAWYVLLRKKKKKKKKKKKDRNLKGWIC